MNAISLYTLLALIYLGLTKSFAPSEQRTPYVVNERVFHGRFQGAPLSLILTDSFNTGFLIKTYYQRYKIIHGFKHSEQVIVRTSKDFWDKNLKNVGMSLFRRKDKKSNASTVVLPPGSLFLGDPAFGRWTHIDSGQRVWKFHRPYRTFPQEFGWQDFRPDQKFYNMLKIHEKNGQAFYGLNNEFGAEGSVTKNAYQGYLENKNQNVRLTFKKKMSKLVSMLLKI